MELAEGIELTQKSGQLNQDSAVEMSESVQETDALFMEEVMRDQYYDSQFGSSCWQPGDSIPMNFRHGHKDYKGIVTKKLEDPDKKEGSLCFHAHNFEGETFIVEWYRKGGRYDVI